MGPEYGHHTTTIYTAAAYQLAAPSGAATFSALDGTRVPEEHAAHPQHQHGECWISASDLYKVPAPALPNIISVWVL